MDDHLYIPLDIISVNNLTFSSLFYFMNALLIKYIHLISIILIFVVSFYGDIVISKYTMFGIMSGDHIFSQPICDEPSNFPKIPKCQYPWTKLSFNMFVDVFVLICH